MIHQHGLTALTVTVMKWGSEGLSGNAKVDTAKMSAALAFPGEHPGTCTLPEVQVEYSNC